jgi:hypothetical protein
MGRREGNRDHDERAAAWVAAQANRAAASPERFAAEEQAKACTVGFGREERLEHAGSIRRRHSRSIIDHRDSGNAAALARLVGLR